MVGVILCDKNKSGYQVMIIARQLLKTGATRLHSLKRIRMASTGLSWKQNHLSQFSTGKGPQGGIDHQKIKQEGKQFYENFVDNIIEISTTEEWQRIIPNTKEPIVVDLYADWCGPCKQLTPRLEERVNSMKGVKMVKINIDKCPEIASALQVKSVPTVYLVYQGQAVDGFSGNVGDSELARFFKTAQKIAGTNPEEIKAIRTLEAAKDLIGQNRMQEAMNLLEDAFKDVKVKEDLIALKDLFLAQCYLSLNKVGKFKDTFAGLSRHQEFLKEVPELFKFYEIMKEEVKRIEEQSKEDPEVLALKHKIQDLPPGHKNATLGYKMELAELYRSKEMIEESINTALEVVKEDKNWQDKKANKFLLDVFKQLGNGSPLVQKYRKIFQRLLN